jgi:hypothetical protein
VRIFLAFLAAGMGMLAGGCGGETAFDSARWKADRHAYCGATESRYAMVDDLVQNHLETKMARREVFALLGEPDRRNGTSIDYRLGEKSGFGVDCDFLTVTFSRGRLARTFVWQS